jgi:leucine dehydrogenase
VSAVVEKRTTGTAPGAAVPPSQSPTSSVPPVPLEHEDLVLHRGARSGQYVILAIHSTALGPALGGVRLWRYPAPTDGIRDALRLARGMTLKAAAAGLALGGGKGVICGPERAPTGRERRDLLLDFGDLVESLEGRYITAEDVGISPPDLVAIRERTAHVTGLPADHGGSGDPSPYTAIGVEAAMRACARARFGSPDLSGRRIVIAGMGHVGAKLARRLVEHGAEVSASDIDLSKRKLAHELGAEWLEPTRQLTAECDILAPCALGGAIDAANLPLLRCEIVCGCANNQLADDSLAGELDERGILYAPDFVVNAGGLIHVYREIRGYSEEHARELALGIEDNLDGIFAASAEESVTPLEAARAIALERLADARLERTAVA